MMASKPRPALDGFYPTQLRPYHPHVLGHGPNFSSPMAPYESRERAMASSQLVRQDACRTHATGYGHDMKAIVEIAISIDRKLEEEADGAPREATRVAEMYEDHQARRTSAGGHPLQGPIIIASGIS